MLTEKHRTIAVAVYWAAKNYKGEETEKVKEAEKIIAKMKIEDSSSIDEEKVRAEYKKIEGNADAILQKGRYLAQFIN